METFRIFGDDNKPIISMNINDANKTAKEIMNEIPIYKSQKYLMNFKKNNEMNNEKNNEMNNENNNDEMVIEYDDRYKEIMGDEKFLIVDDMFKDIKDFVFIGFSNVSVVFIGEEMKVNSIISDGDVILCEMNEKLEYIECNKLNIYKEQPNLFTLFYIESEGISRDLIPNAKVMNV